MRAIRLPYPGRLSTSVLSGVLGAWLHVLFDSFLYRDIRPFFPFEGNLLRGLVSSEGVHSVCLVCFPVALLLYVGIRLLGRTRGGRRRAS
jgi:membrane-bound metal-dependent hydrolase YbcI (DUF457 family)